MIYFNRILDTFLNRLKNINKKILRIIKYGLLFSSILCLISCVILLTYLFYFSSPSLFLAGINMFKIGIILGVEFIVCGLSFEIINNQI